MAWASVANGGGGKSKSKGFVKARVRGKPGGSELRKKKCL